MKIINKNFTFLVFSNFFDGAATQFSIFLFPLIAIYLYNTNLMKTSLITFVTFIPNLLFSNHIGIFVDNHRKKKILLICNILSSICVLFLLLLILLKIKNILFFYLIIFLINVIKIFYNLTYSSYIPILVEKEKLRKANVILEFLNSFVQVILPTMLGILIKYMSLSAMTFGYVVVYIISMVTQIFIKKEEKKEKKVKINYVKNIKESYKFVFSHNLLRPIIICYVILVLSIGIFTSIQPFYILKELKLEKTDLGIIMGLGNIGFFIGSLIISKISKNIKTSKLILISLFLYFLGYLTFYFFKSKNALIFGQILISSAIPIYNVNVVTLRQKVTAIDKLASTNAIFRIFGRGIVPIGALLGGLLGEFFNLKFVILFSAIIILFSTIPIILSNNLMNEGE